MSAMRERTTWSRHKIASQLKRVADDPRAMNQDHLQQQPAADAYVIGGPSEFAEDLSNSGPSWKADLDGDGNTKRDEIGLPQFRGDTFNNPEKSPGVSPSRQAARRAFEEEIQVKAELATKVARLMLSSASSEMAIENQALQLMDLPVANLENTLSRLAQDQSKEADEDDEDGGQQKEAADQDDDDGDDGAQSKQAKGLPPEFLEQQQKKKDEAKDKDKGQDKEARARRAQQQDDDGDDDGGQQQKQAKSRKAQQQDDDADDDAAQQKQAKSRKAQQQQQDDDDGGQQQQKQAKSRRAQQQQDDDGGDDDGGGQQKQADQQSEEGAEEKQVGKEAYALIRQAATDLLAHPPAARLPIFKALLPSLAKVAAIGMRKQGQQQLATEQLLAQVQQLVQQAMQQQSQQGLQAQQQQAQQQPQSQQQLPQLGQQQQVADQALVDQMLGDEPMLAEDQIQMDPPDMDLGLVAEEDPALQAIFASDLEVQQALEARNLDRGHQPTAARTASTRTVGTRPTAGVSQLGGASSAGSSGREEIDKLAGMWSSAPDVSSVFRS